MKKSTILLFVLFLSTGSLFCQVAKDSLTDNFINPVFYDRMSPEESWKIHKEAYVKQLKSDGLKANEIENKITLYDKQKKEFLENIIKQKKLAALQRKEAEKLRVQAEIQRKQADVQSQKAERLREQADEQRKQADILRLQAEENRSQNTLRKEQIEALRKQAATQRQDAEKLRDEAKKQMKEANILRKEAEVQRMKAEEWRNSFETIFTKKITFSSQSTNSKPIIIKVDKKTPLLFNITARISSGNTLIEIFNPNGEKKGELSLEYIAKSNINGDDEFLKSTTAALNKTISDPGVGDWQIKISSTKSKGTATISVAQYKKPIMDE